MTPAGAWDIAGFCGGAIFDYVLVIVVGLVLLLSGSCATNPAPVDVTPNEPEIYSIPLRARDRDRMCAVTNTEFQPCRTIGEVRLFLLSLKAGP